VNIIYLRFMLKKINKEELCEQLLEELELIGSDKAVMLFTEYNRVALGELTDLVQQYAALATKFQEVLNKINEDTLYKTSVN
jgi:hypothetical protein